MRLVLLLIGLVVGFAAGIFFTVYYFDQVVTALGPVLGFTEVSTDDAFDVITQKYPGGPGVKRQCMRSPSDSLWCPRR
jgi:hypothetical protein